MDCASGRDIAADNAHGYQYHADAAHVALMASSVMYAAYANWHISATEVKWQRRHCWNYSINSVRLSAEIEILRQVIKMKSQKQSVINEQTLKTDFKNPPNIAAFLCEVWFGPASPTMN